MCLDGLREKHRHKKQDNYPQEVFHLIFKLEILLNKDKKNLIEKQRGKYNMLPQNNGVKPNIKINYMLKNIIIKDKKSLISVLMKSILY